jgi:hypothetical protein
MSILWNFLCISIHTKGVPIDNSMLVQWLDPIPQHQSFQYQIPVASFHSEFSRLNL